MLYRFFRSPRMVALYWALFAWSAAAAYWQKTPTQLDPVMQLIPGEHVFIIWSITGVLLTAGALIPHHGSSRVMRVGGLAILTWLLVVWATAYFWDAYVDGTRLWVSGKNYLFLAAAAVGTSPIIGRNPVGNGLIDCPPGGHHDERR